MSRAFRVLTSFRFRFIVILAICLLAATVATPRVVSAQGVNDFVFNDFVADYNLTNDDPQGELEITETMTITYSGQNRGIIRAIPSTYNDQSLNIEVLNVLRDNKPEPYITYTDENNNLLIRIGDPEVYITGQHSYALSYSVQNVIQFYDDYDELYWDINGDQWSQTFESVELHLVHKTVASAGLPAKCFTGAIGDQSSNCSLVEDTNLLEVKTTQPLQSGETLTIVKSFEKGYFTEPTWLEKYQKQFRGAPFVLAQMVLVYSAYRKWHLRGRDRTKRATAPFFGRPKGVSVMMADYVGDNVLDAKALSASIIDLSIRGYVQIVERKEGRKVRHDLVLKNTDLTKLAEEEKMLVEGLFDSIKPESVVELESKKQALYKTYTSIKSVIQTNAEKSSYYDTAPHKRGSVLRKETLISLALLVIAFLAIEVIGGLAVVAGLIGFALILIFMMLMTKRSQKGVELAEHMEGLKLYLKMAEKDRLDMQDAVEAPLAPRSGQPIRDVKFFEKLLPFAVAMGVEKSWAKAFADIYTQPPEWYNGSMNTFTTAALVDSLSKTSSIAQQSFSAPSNSSGSGFSGGGFSGGGGGGGGGGGW